MSQKTKNGDKKGAKPNSHIGQSNKVSLNPEEESKGSGLTQQSTTAKNKRLHKNPEGKVSPTKSRPTKPATSAEARQTAKSKAKVAANSTLDSHFK